MVLASEYSCNVVLNIVCACVIVRVIARVIARDAVHAVEQYSVNLTVCADSSTRARAPLDSDCGCVVLQ